MKKQTRIKHRHTAVTQLTTENISHIRMFPCRMPLDIVGV